jgi:hypothetical protein
MARARTRAAGILHGRSAPAAWNQWAEVVGRDARKVRFVGDMPHAWIASDFIRAVLDLFAYERSGDHALVLAAGVPPEWLRAKASPYPACTPRSDGSATRCADDGRHIALHVDGGMHLPPGGIVLSWPGRGLPGRHPSTASARHGATASCASPNFRPTSWSSRKTGQAVSTSTRIEFPADFLWGSATSAYQVEGSPLADGAGPSIWQRFCHTPNLVRDGDTGDVACDHYRRYRDDVALMRASA